MRFVLRIGLAVLVCTILLAGLAVSWVRFYSRDLPDINHLAQFAPLAKQQVTDPCLGLVTAIPHEKIGRNLTDAIYSTHPSLNGADASLDSAFLSSQISRTLFCTQGKMLARNIKELRTALLLRRRFSRRDLFAIYTNRVYLEDGCIGVQCASQRFFHKGPDELSAAEAALIAGLIEQPLYYSPIHHPERAIERRNRILDSMVLSGKLSLHDAQIAKSEPLFN